MRSSPVSSLMRFDRREFFKTPSASSLLDEAPPRASDGIINGFLQSNFSRLFMHEIPRCVNILPVVPVQLLNRGVEDPYPAHFTIISAARDDLLIRVLVPGNTRDCHTLVPGLTDPVHKKESPERFPRRIFLSGSKGTQTGENGAPLVKISILPD